jgi:hypothetical protein
MKNVNPDVEAFTFTCLYVNHVFKSIMHAHGHHEELL